MTGPLQKEKVFATFVGGKDAPQFIKLYGYTFPRGEPVEIDPNQVAYEVYTRVGGMKKLKSKAMLLEKLNGNQEFKIDVKKSKLKKPAEKVDDGSGDA